MKLENKWEGMTHEEIKQLPEEEQQAYYDYLRAWSEQDRKEREEFHRQLKEVFKNNFREEVGEEFNEADMDDRYKWKFERFSYIGTIVSYNPNPWETYKFYNHSYRKVDELDRKDNLFHKHETHAGYSLEHNGQWFAKGLYDAFKVIEGEHYIYIITWSEYSDDAHVEKFWTHDGSRVKGSRRSRRVKRSNKGAFIKINRERVYILEGSNINE